MQYLYMQQCFNGKESNKWILINSVYNLFSNYTKLLVLEEKYQNLSNAIPTAKCPWIIYKKIHI